MKPNGVFASFQAHPVEVFIAYSKKKQFNSSTDLIETEYEKYYAILLQTKVFHCARWTCFARLTCFASI